MKKWTEFIAETDSLPNQQKDPVIRDKLKKAAAFVIDQIGDKEIWEFGTFLKKMQSTLYQTVKDYYDTSWHDQESPM
jgi:hypothetical protein